MKLGNNKLTYVLVIVGVLIIGAVGAALSSTKPQTKTVTVSQKPSEQPKTSPKYEATVVSYEPTNPATIAFVAKVKNTGDAAGTPDCKVKGSDSSGTYKGYDYFKIDPLEPSKDQSFNGVITITKEGASYVSKMEISCN